MSIADYSARKKFPDCINQKKKKGGCDRRGKRARDML